MAMALRRALPGEMQRATRKIVVRAAIGLAVSAVALMLFLRFALNFDFNALLNVVSEAFNYSSGDSDDVIGRRDQYFALMDGWANSPLLGTGLGGVTTMIRSYEMPWAYELSYVALLFHTGLIGLLVYAAGVTWTYVMGLLVIRNDRQLGVYMAPVLVGTTCFLIGNASNPYLEKFDALWVLFLPIAIVNLWLLKRRAASKEAVSMPQPEPPIGRVPSLDVITVNWNSGDRAAPVPGLASCAARMGSGSNVSSTWSITPLRTARSMA